MTISPEDAAALYRAALRLEAACATTTPALQPPPGTRLRAACEETSQLAAEMRRKYES